MGGCQHGVGEVLLTEQMNPVPGRSRPPLSQRGAPSRVWPRGRTLLSKATTIHSHIRTPTAESRAGRVRRLAWGHLDTPKGVSEPAIELATFRLPSPSTEDGFLRE